MSTRYRFGRLVCVLVVDQREQQMLERRVFVVPLVGERQRPVEGLLEAA